MEKTMSRTRFAMPTKVFVGASTLFILSILYLMIQEPASQRNQDFSEAIISGDQHIVHQLITALCRRPFAYVRGYMSICDYQDSLEMRPENFAWDSDTSESQRHHPKLFCIIPVSMV